MVLTYDEDLECIEFTVEQYSKCLISPGYLKKVVEVLKSREYPSGSVFKTFYVTREKDLTILKDPFKQETYVELKEDDIDAFIFQVEALCGEVIYSYA